MGELTREEIRDVLASFDISSARHALGTAEDEEILLIDGADYGRTNNASVTTAVMNMLPHVKDWVVPASLGWETEQL